MLNVDEVGAAITAVLMAVTAGAIGGLVSELLLERGKAAKTGVLVLPARAGRRLELGSLAAVVVGTGAGLVAALLLVPVEEVVVNRVQERQVDWMRVVGVALTAGAAGQAFWAAVTKGLTASDYKARMESVLATLKGNDAAGGGAASPQLQGAISAVEKALEEAP